MRKRVLWLIIIAVLCVGALYAYREFGRTREDSRAMDARFTVSAEEILKEFIANEDSAKKKYAGNELIIAVEGPIKELHMEQSGAYSVVLGDSSSESSVICLLDSVYQEEIKALNVHELVQLKGRFNGFKADDLGIGSDVELNFCVIEKKSK
jgi:tRNA_anti-like